MSLPAFARARSQEPRAELPGIPAQVPVSSGWEMQDIARIPENAAGAGARISKVTYKPKGWYEAVVPGTVLTTLVKNGVYPEPLYGENNRPDRIPESLNKT